MPDPSRLLKIAADTRPGLRVCATGSSTLAATKKFRDSLIRRRLLHGGLPALLLEDEPDAEAYSEWLDSFFARDVQELFRVEKRAAFLRMSRPAPPEAHFWRDKSGRAVDFVLARGRGVADAIECKWSAKAFSPKALAAFRALHPKGRNFLVVPGPKEPFVLRLGELSVTVTDLSGMVAALEK